MLDVRIEINPEHWDLLRHQSRSFGDAVQEIEQHRLSRPFAGIYDWFSATVTVNGEIYTDVGVRKKGFVKSQSTTKPSLKLSFGRNVNGQAVGGVLERMTLNNSVQDASMINTCFGVPGVRSGRQPTSRCNFATFRSMATSWGCMCSRGVEGSVLVALVRSSRRQSL